MHSQAAPTDYPSGSDESATIGVLPGGIGCAVVDLLGPHRDFDAALRKHATAMPLANESDDTARGGIAAVPWGQETRSVEIP